jgi:hypothetical protein
MVPLLVDMAENESVVKPPLNVTLPPLLLTMRSVGKRRVPGLCITEKR